MIAAADHVLLFVQRRVDICSIPSGKVMLVWVPQGVLLFHKQMVLMGQATKRLKLGVWSPFDIVDKHPNRIGR